MNKFTLLLLFLAFFPLQLHARTMVPADAEKLKSSFQELLDYQKIVNEAFGGVRVIYEGDLTVIPQDEFYAVTFPRILIKSPIIKDDEGNDITKENTFDMGVITMNTMPDDKDGYWKVIMTLPQQMTLAEEKEDGDFSVNFESQNIVGIYNTNLGYFTKINMNLSDVKFIANGEDTGINVGNFQVFNNSEETEEGKFSGPGHILISDLVISLPDEQDTPASFGELKMDFSMTDFIFPKLSEYQDKLVKLSETLTVSGVKEDVADKDLISNILNLYNFDMNGISFGYSLKDMNVTIDPLNEKKYETFKLDSASLGFELDGVKSEKGNFRITQSLDGFTISPPKKELEGVAPNNINLDINLENVPFTSLFDVAKTSVAAIAENPDSAQFVGLGLLMRMPALLASSGTKLSIKDNGLKNDVYDLNLNGEILTDLTSMTGFVANSKAVFQGLDALLERVKERPEGLPESITSDMVRLESTLEKAKSIGKVGTTDNGKPAYIYEFEATKEGQLLLNGQSLQDALK